MLYAALDLLMFGFGCLLGCLMLVLHLLSSVDVVIISVVVVVSGFVSAWWFCQCLLASDKNEGTGFVSA